MHYSEFHTNDMKSLTRKCFLTEFTLLLAVVEMSTDVFNVGSLRA